MNIPRLVQQQIMSKLGTQKVLMLYGTRRTGKTTIIESIFCKYPDDTLLLQGEDMQVSEILQREDNNKLYKVDRRQKDCYYR